MPDNVLYYGDNLDILRRYVKDETVDLVYLDPPFKSNQDYNVLFAEQNGTRSAAQIKAFEDTWRWDQAAAEAYHEMVEQGPESVSKAMQAFRLLLGDSDMLAYLAMIAPRLVELLRVLKPTGSIYLHCDPTASHYLKLLMDSVFGPVNFKTEIVWKRSSAHSDTKQGRNQHGRIHDTLLFYVKGSQWTWNPQYTPYDQEYIDVFYHNIEPGTGRWFQYGDLTGPGGAAKGNPYYEFLGVERYWRYTQERMEQLRKEGRIAFRPSGEVPRLKRYLDEALGLPLQSVWTDIRPLINFGSERLGYPTQKPEALLERIIKASSNEGDTVLDPFCGCGTAVAVAQRLDRKWIGVDITFLAINLLKHRLKNSYGDEVAYKVVGEPVTLSEATELAEQDPYQFQFWALGLVGARPAEQKKGADKGIDGRLYFHDDIGSDKTKQVIFSVKAGHTNVAHLRDLRGVLDREKADMGVLITLQESTQPMRTEAAGAGFYHSPIWHKDYPRLQIRTVGELLAGHNVDMPPIGQVNATYKKAPKAKQPDASTIPMALS